MPENVLVILIDAAVADYFILGGFDNEIFQPFFEFLRPFTGTIDIGNAYPLIRR